jgi:hypothetical protein
VCSYCGCRSITVIQRLTDEHEQIINAAGLLRDAAHRGRLGLWGAKTRLKSLTCWVR